ISNDILFVGVDKGRKNQLDDLKNLFDDMGFANQIYVVGNRNLFGQHKGNQPIGYGKYLEYIAGSKALLDLVQTKQTGLTLRVMESIFFNKKLITNDLNIDTQPFYNKNNIFILGKDKMESLKSFLDLPYESLSEEIVNYYDVSTWLGRFDSHIG